MVGSTVRFAQQRLLIDGSVRLVRDERGTTNIVADPYVAMRECIDRLRSGWAAFDADDIANAPTWRKYPRWVEPMTPEQAAVMARSSA